MTLPRVVGIALHTCLLVAVAGCEAEVDPNAPPPPDPEMQRLAGTYDLDVDATRAEIQRLIDEAPDFAKDEDIEALQRAASDLMWSLTITEIGDVSVTFREDGEQWTGGGAWKIEEGEITMKLTVHGGSRETLYGRADGSTIRLERYLTRQVSLPLIFRPRVPETRDSGQP